MTLPTYSLLIVEQSSAVREQYQRDLQANSACNYQWLAATSIAAGVELCRTSAIDVVLLGESLANIKGLTFLEALSDRGLVDRPGVVMITSTVETSVAVRAIKLGAEDYLVKPVTPERLQSAVQSAIETARSQWQDDRDQSNIEIQVAGGGLARSDYDGKRTEGEIRRILDGLFSFVGILTPDGTLIEANRTALEAARLLPEDVIGHPFPDAYWWSYDAATQAQLWTAIHQAAAGSTVRYDVPVRLSTDHFITIDFGLTPLLNESGQVELLIPSGIDITDRKRTEAALKDSMGQIKDYVERMTLALDAAKMASWYWDLVTGEITWSSYYEILWGYQPGTPNRRYEDWSRRVHPDDLPRVEAAIEMAKQAKTDFLEEYRVILADGTLRWVAGFGRFYVNNEGEPYRMMGTVQDITDRKDTELLQREKEAAEAANRAKSIFLSNMSHELRTPLNSILGFTQLMLNENALSPSSQERLEIVTRSGEYLLDLIDDILDLSKIESGRMTLNNSEFDLTILLTSIQQMLQVKVQPKNVHLIFEQDPNLPRYICTDQKKLYQVLVNLLGNAIKFTKHGSVILRVRVASTDETSCNLYFEVEDTGVGIAPEEIDNLFKAFVQAQAGNNLNQGTGLGLAISQKIIQLMGSQIHVQSTLNQGSTFSFNIEVQLPQVAVFTSEPLNQRVIGLAPNQPPYRILVVEDLAENRLLLVGILSSIGFEVREVTNGIEAIALWESWSPHLIMMDLKMPLMDGYTATKRVRENPKSQETIIIALTASVFEEDREKVVNVGCNDFIRKPFQQKELFEKIAQHLGVQYIYKTIEESPQKSSVELLSVEALSEMSPQWLEDMYQAAYYLDADVMNELIAKIPKSKASLSKALTDSINNFSYERILELIRSLEYV